MRIGFDVSQTAETMAGCGIFADQLFRHLVVADSPHTFLPYPIFEGYRHPAFKKATRPDTANVLALHHEQSWNALIAGWGAQGDRHEFLGRPDLVHSNSFACPRRIGAPLVYTVYDLSPIEHPEFHTEANRLVCFNGMFEASLYAARFIAISGFTRDRFLHWFPHIRPESVAVVHPAARPTLSELTEATADKALAALKLPPEPFWLAVGTIEPRKNYPLLLDAYARVRATRPDLPPLYIAGQAGWKESSLEPRIRALGLDDHVRCLGFVSDEQLAALYRHCLALIFPTHYEGFGLPVIEALACGAAVIASRVASVPEVVGDAGLLFTPGSEDELAEAMTSMLTEPGIRERLRERAHARSTQFSWCRAAAQTLDVYSATLDEQRGHAR